MYSGSNNDCKQCTESKLGWVHSAHTQNPGRMHTARAVPRSWALLRSQPTGRAHVARTARACRDLVGRGLVATCPGSLPQVATSLRCRDIKAARIMSRHQIGVATPLSQLQVATSWRLTYVATSISCRDLVSATVRLPGRDTEIHVATSHTVAHVATSNPCRDTISAQPKQTRSRLQIDVATSNCLSQATT